MGILNVTPDSFSDGGQFYDADRAIAHAREMAGQGADILDIGAESTRPYGGAKPVSADDELARLKPVLPAVAALGLPGVALAAAASPSSLTFKELDRVTDTTDHWPEGYRRQILLKWGDV